MINTDFECRKLFGVFLTAKYSQSPFYVSFFVFIYVPHETFFGNEKRHSGAVLMSSDAARRQSTDELICISLSMFTEKPIMTFRNQRETFTITVSASLQFFSKPIIKNPQLLHTSLQILVVHFNCGRSSDTPTAI